MDWAALFSTVSVSNWILGILSMGWLLWRARKVLQTPVEELVTLLGIEIPAAPIATLLDISTNSISVHLKHTDQRNLAVKYAVRVNGALAGEVSGHDSAITIQDLQPGQFYLLRIVAVNATSFQASSEPVRVKTMEASANDAPTANGIRTNQHPSVVPYKSFNEATLPSAAPPTVGREHSNSVSNRRANMARRGSPAALQENTTPPSEMVPGGDAAETVLSLTTTLDTTTKEIEDLIRADEEEEREFQSTQRQLNDRRDALRQQLKERDDDSSELKKTVTGLERQNTPMQAKRSKLEKALTQKMHDREKFRDDMSRWTREANEFELDAEQLVVQRQESLNASKQSIQSVRKEQEVDQQAIKMSEEKIRETGTHVKDLEEEKRALEEDADDVAAYANHIKNQDMDWTERFRVLNMRYHSAWLTCQQAQVALHNVQQRLHSANSSYGTQVNNYGPSYGSDTQAFSGESQASHQTPIPRLNSAKTGSPRLLIPQQRPISGQFAAFQSPSPFFSTASLSSSTPNENQNDDGMSEADLEALTGGALASPTAGALLPAGLLGDDSEDILQNGQQITKTPYLPGLGTVPHSDGEEAVDDTRPDLASPLSYESRSPSLVSSPQGSVSNFHHHPRHSEGRIDSDGMSIRSTSSSTRVMNKRIGELFGIQRARATSNEGLPLGSLKNHQSRSMPRYNDESSQPSGDSSISQRRGISSGGLFGFGSMSYALGRRGTEASSVNEDGALDMSANQSTSRGGQFIMFTSRNSPWAKSSSSRPSSTYSVENALPPPSSDNQQPFGWSAAEPPESSIINPPRPTSRSKPWTKYASRRQSADPSPSLLQNISQLEEDSQELHEEHQSPLQAPIGTKPSQDSPQRLNPAARDFRSLLTGRERRAEKAKKGDKTPSVEETTGHVWESSSPPEMRKSREMRIWSATGSSEDLSEDHGGSPSKNGDNSSQPGSATKESFMRKMTRKGSSSKFSLPTSFKEKGGGLFSRKGVQAEEVLEEDVTGMSQGKSADSLANSQQSSSDKRSSGFSLSSFKRRKKGTEAPSISEASVASETGDEAEEKPSVDTDEF